MVLLSLIKQAFTAEDPFERGHPVQLLLMFFNQWNQDAVALLLNKIETILPTISNESRKLTESAENIFNSALKQHQYYLSATDEEKEYIEQEIKRAQKKSKKQKKKKHKNKSKDKNETKQSELESIEKEDSKESKDKEWMDEEQFRVCDLYFRKAIKLSPKCIKCHLKHLKFSFQCNKTEQTKQLFRKTLTVIDNLRRSKKSDVNTKYSKRAKKKQNTIRMNSLSISDLNSIKTLVIFYFGYLYYMRDDTETFTKYVHRCLDLEPNNVGIRLQNVVCLITLQKHSEAYSYLIETLQLLNDKEKQYIKDENNIKNTQSNSAFGTMETIRHYRVICGIGAAVIRSVFGIDYEMMAQHLRFAIDNSQTNNGIIKYCLSYALYKSGHYEESNEFYNKFVQYISGKRSDAQKRKTDRNKSIEKTQSEIESEGRTNATAELSLDYFQWHPNMHQSNASELFDVLLDMFAVFMVIILTYFIAGYTPHLGNNIQDWFVICVVFIISCVLVTPSLGLMLMAVSLPPSNTADFNYMTFGAKWLCVSAGLLFVYRVIIGGEIPKQKWF